MDYGILSIIPAVLAIVLAMITKNIVISKSEAKRS